MQYGCNFSAPAWNAREGYEFILRLLSVIFCKLPVLEETNGYLKEIMGAAVDLRG